MLLWPSTIQIDNYWFWYFNGSINTRHHWLMMLLRPIPTAIIATVANDHRVYVHSLSGALLLLLLLLSVDNNDYDTSIVMLLWPSRSIITGSSLIGEDFAIAYAFTPSLLLLLLLHCDRDCFRNNDDSFNDTDTSTYYELRPQQRRYFLILLLILVPTTTAAPTTFAVADDDPTTTRLLLLLTILQYMPIYHHQHRYRYWYVSFPSIQFLLW